jgi:hypothetical protein
MPAADRLDILLALRAAGVVVRYGDLPGLTPTDTWACEASPDGVLVVAPRRSGLTAEAWTWAHEAAHAAHPETLAVVDGDERAEALGDFAATERRIARRLGCLETTVRVQRDTLRRCLATDTLTADERRVATRRLRALAAY